MALIIYFDFRMTKPKTYEQKWAEVKAFYEASYQPAFRKKGDAPFEFKKAPTELELEFLFDQMRKLKAYFQRFYEKRSGLADQLVQIRGHAHVFTKRSPFE